MATPSRRLPKVSAGPRGLSRNLVAAHQQERILNAATELFGQQGYHQTTLEQITKQARVAWSTLYQNFETKEDVYLAAFDQAVEHAAGRVTETVPSEAGWEDRATIATETLIELAADDPIRARLCLVEFQSAGPAARGRYEALIERLAAALREGRKLNRGAGRPERLEESIVGGIAWLVQGSLTEGEIARLRGLLPEILQIALTPYVGEDEANRRALAVGSGR